MKLTFLGTRGNIEPESERHRRYTALLVAYRGREVMVDCGAGWEDRLGELSPRAVVVTHAHPDHVDGLAHGAPCPVWATGEAWERLGGFPIGEDRRRTVRPRKPFTVEGVEGIAFEAFPVEHSLRAPAVGYRIVAGRVTIFYASDVVYIPDRTEAMAGCRLYVGDGATIDGDLVRRQGDRIFGHAPVRTQLTWCRKEGVPKMVVTHCGDQIVRGELEDPEAVRAKLEGYAEERGVEVEVATDGMELVLR